MITCEICSEDNLDEYADPNLKNVCVLCTDSSMEVYEI